MAIRRAWARVSGILVLDPEIMPIKFTSHNVHEAVPEIAFPQPKGFERAVAMTKGRPAPKRMLAQELAELIGVQARHTHDLVPVFRALNRAMAVPVPLYFEDDLTGVGSCAVCGKRGAFGRCPRCGALIHVRCMGRPTEDGTEVDCPRCKAQSSPDKSEEFEPGALANFPVGRERGLDPTLPCPVVNTYL